MNLSFLHQFYKSYSTGGFWIYQDCTVFNLKDDEHRCPDLMAEWEKASLHARLQ